MRIAFFAHFGTFSHYNIGGTDSIARRISYELAARKHKTRFVTFGAPQQVQSEGQNGVPVRDFVQLEDALHYLRTGFDDVITIHLPPRQRIKYALVFGNQEIHSSAVNKLGSCQRI